MASSNDAVPSGGGVGNSVIAIDDTSRAGGTMAGLAGGEVEEKGADVPSSPTSGSTETASTPLNDTTNFQGEGFGRRVWVDPSGAPRGASAYETLNPDGGHHASNGSVEDQVSGTDEENVSEEDAVGSGIGTNTSGCVDESAGAAFGSDAEGVHDDNASNPGSGDDETTGIHGGSASDEPTDTMSCRENGSTRRESSDASANYDHDTSTDEITLTSSARSAEYKMHCRQCESCRLSKHCIYANSVAFAMRTVPHDVYLEHYLKCEFCRRRPDLICTSTTEYLQESPSGSGSISDLSSAQGGSPASVENVTSSACEAEDSPDRDISLAARSVAADEYSTVSHARQLLLGDLDAIAERTTDDGSSFSNEAVRNDEGLSGKCGEAEFLSSETRSDDDDSKSDATPSAILPVVALDNAILDDENSKECGVSATNSASPKAKGTVTEKPKLRIRISTKNTDYDTRAATQSALFCASDSAPPAIQPVAAVDKAMLDDENSKECDVSATNSASPPAKGAVTNSASPQAMGVVTEKPKLRIRISTKNTDHATPAATRSALFCDSDYAPPAIQPVAAVDNVFLADKKSEDCATNAATCQVKGTVTEKPKLRIRISTKYTEYDTRAAVGSALFCDNDSAPPVVLPVAASRITDEEEDVNREKPAVKDTSTVESSFSYVAPVKSHDADAALSNGRTSGYDELVSSKTGQNIKKRGSYAG